MKKHQSFAIHEAAPELLLDKIAELNIIIGKHKAKNADSEKLTFWNNLLRVMKFSFSYMRETQYIHQRNILLESQVRFLSQENHEISEQLKEIHTVQRLQCQGRLDEVVESAQAYTDNVLSFYKNENDE